MRNFLKVIPIVALLAVSCSGAVPEAEETAPVEAESPAPVSVDLNRTLTNQMSSLDSLDLDIEAFLSRWGIRGMSLSVMRNDSLLYSRGYGIADEGRPMTPGTILRVASVSKLITAAGIMKLCDQGLLDIHDPVFGPEGILKTYNDLIRDRRYYSITVEDLLRHEAGFTSKRSGDPLFSTRKLMREFKLEDPPDREDLMHILLPRPLAYFPGTANEYSNLGFLLLSYIIEEVTGTDYESWMQDNVLVPAGCTGMHIAHNYYEEKYPDETRYHMQRYDRPVPEYNNSGRDVERCYGGNDIRALSGAGAWVTSTPELARFVASIDRCGIVPEVISADAVDEMTRWYDRFTYSLGWNDTSPWSGWQRTGTFSGTNALIKYYPDGECWILITNTNVFLGSKFSRYTSQLCNRCKARHSGNLPLRNLFYE